MTIDVRDNLAQGLSRVPSQFNASPLLDGTLTTYLTEDNKIRDCAIEWIEGVLINTAIGIQLDHIGFMVGELRLNRSDEEYRNAIRTRIVLNIGEGGTEDVRSAAKAIAGSIYARIWEHYPASVIVAVGAENIESIPNDIASIVDASCGAGISCEQVLIDTTGEGLVFGELISERGTVTVLSKDTPVDPVEEFDLIDQSGNLIAWVGGTGTLSGSNGQYAELNDDYSLLEVNGDTLSVNGEGLLITVPDGRIDGTAFYEVI